MKPPITDLPIDVAESGFYKGFTKNVTITAKLLVGALIIWTVAFPEQAAGFLGQINSFILATFNFWYVYAMAFFVLTCVALAAWPAAGRLKLGLEDDKPEFSNFSWFSMMFGAGIGIGMLTFATAEPMYHFVSNPSTIQGLTEGSTAGILGAGQADQLFATLAVMLNSGLAWVMSVIVVVLLLTYLVTSADSAVLIINTINAAGDEGPKARPHIIFWGVALALVVGGLILAGGLGAIKTAMVIGALPFSFVMVLMAISVLKAVYRDSQRENQGLPTTHE